MTCRLLLPAVLMMCVITADAKSLTAAERARIHHSIVETGNAATVGIYCKRGKHERYFGTGVIISEDGYILTSTTVVPRGSEDIEIYLTERLLRLARIIEVNEKLESTLLKIDMDKKLPYLPVAEKLPAIGDRAYSFGNANNMIRLGDGASFSVGVISGVYKVKSADSQSTYEGLALETDAAINPGQDGGPLLNAYGQLVGVISLSYADRRWQGMAVPMPELLNGLKALRDGTVKTSAKPLLKPPPADLAAGNDVAQAAAKVSRALVAIEVKRKYAPEVLPRLYLPTYIKGIKNYDSLTPPQQQRLMREFSLAERTLEANRQLRRPAGQVSGICISADGYIITSLFNVLEDQVLVHKKKGLQKVEYKGSLRDLVVVNPRNYKREANKIQSVTVTLPDGKTLPARIIARHHVLGAALLKIDAAGLDHVDLGTESAAPELGDNVGVLGTVKADTPYTLNTGIVSAARRQRGFQFQFDAMINYGNSGGPVVNAEGKFCGIALHPLSPSPFMGRVLAQQQLQRWMIGLNGGVSFGARADQIAAELPKLMAGKDIKTIAGPFIGIAPKRGSVLSDKVIVGVVTPKSPGQKAGLKVNDQILSLNGTPMTSWKQLIETVSEMEVGDTATLKVKRTAKEQYLTINGKKVSNQKELKKLFKTLKHGQELKARFTAHGNREMDVKVKLEERK